MCLENVIVISRIVFSRMIEGNLPDKAIGLYMRAADVLEVMCINIFIPNIFLIITLK